MQILAIEKKNQELKFPCLMINKLNMILLVMGKEAEMPGYTGIMLINEGHKPFYHNNFNLNDFTVFDGKIVLEN